MTNISNHSFTISHLKVLVTGAAGFIGSNLCEILLEKGAKVVGLDNLSTGNKKNLNICFQHNNFHFIEGDIRNIQDCLTAVRNIDIVLHQAALGSVPRSINDPITTNDVNIGGFLNMLEASRREGVDRFIYAASSSTYGDSESLPKEENKIGNPLSPYAITKYVNELYAANYKKTYNLDTIGLRYFNVFGRKQTPEGAYAAVIPKFVMQLMNYESPTINGDGSFSRDFTYIDNVILMNLLAMTTEDPKALNQIYNTACGANTSLNELVSYLKEGLSVFDPKIENVKVTYGTERKGDVPHSLAAIEKAKQYLNYHPEYNVREGLKEAIKWYWVNLK